MKLHDIIVQNADGGAMGWCTAMPDRRICSEAVRSALEKNPFEKLSSIVFSILEGAILSSELAPGTRLNVAKLAGELDVSATPVREAVDQLCSRGLVRAEQRGDGKYFNYYVFDISNSSIEHLFVARKSVEGMAAYICAEKNWYVDLPRLGRLADEFQSALKAHAMRPARDNPDINITVRLDMAFHGLLVRSTNNEYLIRMYEAIGKTVEYLSVRTNQFLVAGNNHDNLLMLGSQHVTIYRAVKQGFPQLARQAMDKHIDFCANSCLQNRNLVRE